MSFNKENAVAMSAPLSKLLWKKIQEQAFAVRVLRAHLTRRRLAHTYLFVGAEGSAKEDIALAFAASLNCEARNFFLDCSCLPCRKTLERIHPDVRWIGANSKVRSIKIEEVREVINAASFKPYEGEWKVFVFQGADRLTLDAANALLKTFEEPPAHTLFVLLVEHKAHLLETIQSRSFELKLRPSAADCPDTAGHEEMLSSLQEGDWDLLFESYQGARREDLTGLCDALMQHLRDTLQRNVDAGSYTQGRISARLDAIDVVVQTKEALEANANQKLALSRMAVRFTRLLPRGTGS